MPMKTLKIATLFASIALLSVSAAAQTPITPPQGRLSLSSTNPVMTADVVNATTIYYLSYPGNGGPLRRFFGGDIITYEYYSFAPQTLNLNSSQQLTNNIYDIFAFF